ncbi:MAG: hypothetical protein KG003_12475 [Bacteroidetes bacterium]|nr:hypothetical protein [Bacteroidota bacterium]
MKKVIIGAIVSTVLFFGWQSAMWMSGAHNDFASKTPNPDSIMACLNQNIKADGLYTIPSHDPDKKMSREEEEKAMKAMDGKPWAMIFYHNTHSASEGTRIAKGFIHALLASILVALVLWGGNFASFGGRLFVAYSFAIFTAVVSIMTNMNWWDYPMGFIKAELIDLLGGWALSSLWLAWFVKRPSE